MCRSLPCPGLPRRSKGYLGSGESQHCTADKLRVASPALDLLTGRVCSAPGCLVLAGVECVAAGAPRCVRDAYGNLGSRNLGTAAGALGWRPCLGRLPCSLPRTVHRLAQGREVSGAPKTSSAPPTAPEGCSV
jgi:hypothetical protein